VTVGKIVNITGARQFTGRILALTDIAMIVAVAADRSVTLRRDPASTKPDQWRYGGLPVGVSPAPERSPDFADRLAALEKQTRTEDTSNE
jgi:hypothetical protein